ncbi:hypothetical protein BN1708_020082, partial [Verticillium longisporum]
HAGAHPTPRPSRRPPLPRQAGPLHGADVHGHLLLLPRARRHVRHEQHPRLVLQHGRHVRKLSPPHPRRRLQVLLPLPGCLLGPAGHCP